MKSYVVNRLTIDVPEELQGELGRVLRAFRDEHRECRISEWHMSIYDSATEAYFAKPRAASAA